jgi:hypothetical protein
MGHKIGEAGLDRYVSARLIERARRRARQKRGAVAVGMLSLIPPPFPFSPFMLAGGALGIRALVFLSTFAALRLVRFGVEAFLAVRYGRAILGWLESDRIQDIVILVMAAAFLLTALSIVRLMRSSGRPAGSRKAVRA